MVYLRMMFLDVFFLLATWNDFVVIASFMIVGDVGYFTGKLQYGNNN